MIIKRTLKDPRNSENRAVAQLLFGYFLLLLISLTLFAVLNAMLPALLQRALRGHGTAVTLPTVQQHVANEVVVL